MCVKRDVDTLQSALTETRTQLTRCEDVIEQLTSELELAHGQLSRADDTAAKQERLLTDVQEQLAISQTQVRTSDRPRPSGHGIATPRV